MGTNGWMDGQMGTNGGMDKLVWDGRIVNLVRKLNCYSNHTNTVQ